MGVVDAVYFTSAAEFRDWLLANHQTATELWVGFHKVATGRPSMTWAEAVDEALCVGWIDGIRRRVDDERYVNRFTPRRPGSNWSAVNVKRVGELIAQGRMLPAGLAAFEARRTDPAPYSYERRKDITLEPTLERAFRADKAAWKFFTSQPPGYRQTAIFWIMSAKKDDTRQRRLAALIEDSAAGRRLDLMAPGRRPRRD